MRSLAAVLHADQESMRRFQHLACLRYDRLKQRFGIEAVEQAERGVVQYRQVLGLASQLLFCFASIFDLGLELRIRSL